MLNLNLRNLRIIVSLLLISWLVGGIIPAPTHGATKLHANQLPQFTADEHVIGFNSSQLYIASANHLLTMQFVDAQTVEPRARTLPATQHRQVRYPAVWPGISIIYDSQTEALVKSTYVVQPHANPAQIQLNYNQPLHVDSAGRLVINMPHGQLRETAPVAWQIVRGQRQPVEVAFKLTGDYAVQFAVGEYNPAYPLIIDPAIEWNSFFGSPGFDQANAITADSEGFVYVVGTSDSSWAEPVRAYSSGADLFAAKFSRGGKLLWNTFLGGEGVDNGTTIAIDATGRVYVAGTSDTSWGEAVNGHAGQLDMFVAQLSVIGILKWHTFYGSTGDDLANGITVDGSDNVYLIGNSDATWGDNPINAHNGDIDAVLVQLNEIGGYGWHSFLGGPGTDSGEAVAVYDTEEGADRRIYVAGTSSDSWGEAPTLEHTGSRDAFVAQFNTVGELGWNMFLGTAEGGDTAAGITVDSEGNIYVTGSSWDSWGEPTRPFAGAGFFDAFAARINANGTLAWNTFLGSTSQAADADAAYGVIVDRDFNVYVIGDSRESWGEPLDPFMGERDIFATRLNSADGSITWLTFLGSEDFDYGNGIAVDEFRNVFITGYSQAEWGAPGDHPFVGESDGFIAKLPACLPECTGDSPAVAQTEDDQEEEAAAEAQPETEEAELSPSSTTETEAETQAIPIVTNVTGSLDLATIPPHDLTENVNTRISLQELGYENREINSPYAVTEYELRIPEGWDLEGEPFVRMAIDYVFSELATDVANPPEPSLYGNVILALDGETLSVTPLQAPLLTDERFRVNLPLEELRQNSQTPHRLTVALDTSPSCNVPHDARLVINAENTLLSFDYDEAPLAVDLGRYPQPFAQQGLNAAQIIFVLPETPTQAELRGAIAIAARLGNLNEQIEINGMTDQDYLNQLAAGQAPEAHLILLGSPDRNKMISQFNQWDALPTQFREAAVGLTTEGPANLQPGQTVTYNFSVANTAQQQLNSLLLLDTLPPNMNLVSCNPMCNQSSTAAEISWFIDSLGAGEMSNYSLTLEASTALTGVNQLENTLSLLDDSSQLLNVNRFVTTIGQVAGENPTDVRISSPAGRLFVAQRNWVAAETDGLVQATTAPWNPRLGVLVVTGQTEEAIEKAGRAMGIKQQVAGLVGNTALVDQIQPMTNTTSTTPRNIQANLTSLGYANQVLRGARAKADYQFDVPVGWRLGVGSSLNLAYNHSQLIDHDNSLLRVLFNGQPVAETTLNPENSQNGSLQVDLPTSQSRPGNKNRLTVVTKMEALDPCQAMDNSWFVLQDDSALRLDYRPQEPVNASFEVFPRPFSDEPNLANLLFVLPERPMFAEWQQALLLAARIAQRSDGLLFAPQLYLGDGWQTVDLAEHHLITIGRPTNNSLLRAANENLPQPFIPGSDMPQQRLKEVVLRLLPGTSVGIIELIESPWNPDFSLLAVTGTTNEGVAWAGQTLARDTNRLRTGDLAFIKGQQVDTIDTTRLTRQGTSLALSETLNELGETSSESFNGQQTEAQRPAPTSPTPTDNSRPVWLIPLVGVAVILVIVTLTMAYLQDQRRRQEL